MVIRGVASTLAVWAVGAILLRATLVPAHTCPAVTATDMEAAARAAVGWIERAQQPDGTYVYDYDVENDIVLGGYNEVRHAGVTMSLYQYAAETGDLSVLETADRGLQWMIENLFEHDDWMAIDRGGVKLGASSLMLAGLLERREATGDRQHDELMRKLGRFLVAMQREDGSFLNYWLRGRGAPDPNVTSKYATGEAFWALTMMHETFPDEGWDEPAWRVADYLSLYRDEVEGFDFPPWADQWAAYGLSEMADWPLEDHHIDYARRLAQRFGFLIRVESQRTDDWWMKAIHGQKTRAAGHGTWVEALTSLHRLAQADDRLADVRGDIEERAICGAAMLVDRQVTASEATMYANPALAEGAWHREGITRMDDQQHALSGLIRAAPIAAGAAE